MDKKKRKVEGIIIGRRDFKEKDKIIILFSKNEGKIKLLAKGVRKINSRRLSSLELGNLVRIEVFRSGNFDIINEVFVLENIEEIRSEPVKIGATLFVCEIVNLFLPEGEKEGRIFERLGETIRAIKMGRLGETVFFEAEVIRLSGFGLEKRICDLLYQKKLRKAHLFLKRRIKEIIGQEIKTLDFFN